jgi:hypothetical protein
MPVRGFVVIRNQGNFGPGCYRLQVETAGISHCFPVVLLRHSDFFLKTEAVNNVADGLHSLNLHSNFLVMISRWMIKKMRG